MTLSPDEFMRRFLLHVLPSGFHRIRHYGLLANAGRRRQLACVRLLKALPPEQVSDDKSATAMPTFICRCCGGMMQVAEVIMCRQPIREPP
jgi:hypothetical protein